MPQTLLLDRKAIQLYARPSRDDHVWMVCGYATDMDGAPETMHIISGYDVSQMHTIKAGIPLTFPAQPQTNIGDIVTTQNFRGAQTGKELLIMQIVPREVWGQPGLTMFAGILQDPDGKLK